MRVVGKTENQVLDCSSLQIYGEDGKHLTIAGIQKITITLEAGQLAKAEVEVLVSDRNDLYKNIEGLDTFLELELTKIPMEIKLCPKF